jgi:hypothetical protein
MDSGFHRKGQILTNELGWNARSRLWDLGFLTTISI